MFNTAPNSKAHMVVFAAPSLLTILFIVLFLDTNNSLCPLTIKCFFM